MEKNDSEQKPKRLRVEQNDPWKTSYHGIAVGYKGTGLHDQDNHDGVITHLEPDILECESQVGLRKHHYKQS